MLSTTFSFGAAVNAISYQICNMIESTTRKDLNNARLPSKGVLVVVGRRRCGETDCETTKVMDHPRSPLDLSASSGLSTRAVVNTV